MFLIDWIAVSYAPSQKINSFESQVSAGRIDDVCSSKDCHHVFRKTWNSIMESGMAWSRIFRWILIIFMAECIWHLYTNASPEVMVRIPRTFWPFLVCIDSIFKSDYYIFILLRFVVLFFFRSQENIRFKQGNIRPHIKGIYRKYSATAFGWTFHSNKKMFKLKKKKKEF